MKKQLIASILLIASTSYADMPSEHEIRATQALETVVPWLNRVKAGTYENLNEYALKPSQNGTSTPCIDHVEGARKEGIKFLTARAFQAAGGTKDDDGNWRLTIGQAAELCKQGSYYENVVLKDLATFKSQFFDVKESLNQHLSEGGMAALKERIDRCDPAVDALIAAKVATTFPYPVGEAKTVGDLKSKVCGEGKRRFKELVDGMAAGAAADREPYLKAGIKGDKLDLMLEYGVWLPGGYESDDLKDYARASKLFVWLTSDPDSADYVTHTIRTYKFKGNNLLSSSEKTYRRKRGAKLGPAAFK